MLDPVNSLYIVLFAQSLLLGLYLLSQRKIIGLGIFFTAMGTHMALNLAYENGWFLQQINVTHVWGLLYPPSFYLYFKELLFKDFIWRRETFVHFSPWALGVLLILAGVKVYHFIPVIMPLSIVSYLVMLGLTLRKFSILLKQGHSQPPEVLLRWIYLCVGLYLLIVGFDLFRSLAMYFSPDLVEQWATPVLLLMLLALVNIMYIKRLQHPILFEGVGEVETVLSPDNSKNDEQQRLANEFRQLVTQDALYLLPNISLYQVADLMKVSPKRLSTALNQQFEVNFSTFINKMRVEFAQQLLVEPSKSITEIIYESGFNSKASFNFMFKKMTEMTPSQYRAKVQKSVD